MKRLLSMLLVIVLMTGVSVAYAALEVVDDHVVVFGDAGEGYYFAKVKNTGRTAVSLRSSDVIFYDGYDREVAREKYVGTSPSYGFKIRPGDYVYVNEWLYGDEYKRNDIKYYRYNPGSSDDDYEYIRGTCFPELRLLSDDPHVFVRYKNTDPDGVKYSVYVNYGIYDQNRNLLYTGSYPTGSTIGIGPGSTIYFKISINSKMMKYWERNNFIPSYVDAYTVE